MTWGLGDDFISNSLHDRSFCCILEHYDISLVCLEYILQSNGITVDLSYPAAMNVGSKVLPTNIRYLNELSPSQVEHFMSLNSSDCDLYASHKRRLFAIVGSISDIEKRIKDFTLRKLACEQLINSISSYGQDEESFVLI